MGALAETRRLEVCATESPIRPSAHCACSARIRIAGRSQFRKPRADFRVARLALAQAGISNRDARIAHQAAPLCAFHGASAKHVAEFLFGEREQPLQFRRKKRVLFTLGEAGNSAAPSPARGDSTGKRPGKCRSRRRAARWARAIPAESRRAARSSGTKCSAARPERTARRCAPVGQASMHRLQFPHKSGAGVSAASSDAARSSVVTITPRNNHEPRFFIDEACVFREPAEPRIFRGDAFDDRAGIHVGARLEGLREFAAQMFESALRVFRQAHCDSRRPRRSGRSSREDPRCGCRLARALRSKREAPCCS